MPTSDDGDVEPDETFAFTISNVASANANGGACNVDAGHYGIGTASGTGTLRNDDVNRTPSFATPTVTYTWTVGEDIDVVTLPRPCGATARSPMC